MELLKGLRVPLQMPEDFFANSRALLSSVQQTATYDRVFTPEAPELDNLDTRRFLYKLWWSYYVNKTYQSIDNGGFRDYINQLLGDSRTGNLSSFFNPVERAVRAYEYVFDGAFGTEIKVEGSKEVTDAIGNMWKWSNIDGWKNEMLIRCASLGTVGLRVSYSTDGTSSGKRIYLTQEHPSIIREVEEDTRGNLRQIVLEYEREEGEFLETTNPRQLHHYVEYMSTDKFWMVRDGQWWNFQTKQAVKTKEEATIQNVIGVVPYVLVRQSLIGSSFGVPCFYGKDTAIDNLNALATYIVTQIRRHITATWLITGGGPAPTQIPMGDEYILYVQTEPGVSNPTTAKALVTPLNIGAAIQQQDKLQAEITNALPELKATDGEFLSHQSGDTVAQLRLPAEQRILNARNNIESAFVKAQKIGLSLGVFYGMWDLGTGKGLAASEQAFLSGAEEHKFNARPALPLTVSDKLVLAKADQAEAAAHSSGNVPAPIGGNNVPIPKKDTGTFKHPDNTPIVGAQVIFELIGFSFTNQGEQFPPGRVVVVTNDYWFTKLCNDSFVLFTNIQKKFYQ